MMEYRPRQYQSIYNCCLHTDGMTCLYMLEQTTGFGTMQYDAILHSREIDRDHIGLSLIHKPNMADQCFVQNAVDGLAVILPALGESFDAVAIGPGKIRHKYSFMFSSILQQWLFASSLSENHSGGHFLPRSREERQENL